MEDDEYCYGFNSDMFDDASASFSSAARGGSNGALAASRAAVEPKRLDVQSLSRFWWSERRLSDFRRGAQRHVKEYHHVAAKLDGTRIDGGLGSAFLVPRSRVEGRDVEGGVLWIQAPTSDSNAQARRKKEIQDITNRLPFRDREDALKTPKGSAKSTATVFLAMSEIIEATETRVQNTVQGIKFTLRTGPQFEFAFMPGPFFHRNNRDELLEAFNRQQLDDAFSPESSPASSRSSPATTPAILEVSSSIRSTSRGSSRSSSPVDALSRAGSREQTPRSSPSNSIGRSSTVSNSSPAVHDSREYQRSLIRKYVRHGELSAEAIEIAKKIHSSTSYLVGPLIAQSPNVTSDISARRQLWSDLPRRLGEMQRDMLASEKERLDRTQARGSKDDDDTLTYTDIKTLQPITAAAYQERYMRYISASQPEMHPVIRLFEPKPRMVCVAEIPRPASSPLDGSMTLFGTDFSRSSVIDATFLTAWKSITCPRPEELAEWADIVDESVATATYEIISTRITQLTQNVVTSASRLSDSRVIADLSIEQTSVNPGRRSGSRRRSIDQPSIEDLRSHFSRYESTQDDLQSPTKRRRSDGDANIATVRRRRRQSLVAATDPSLEEEKTEDTSGIVQPMDSICPLCCDADAVVVMKPCGHSVCEGCWSRLGYPEDKTPQSSEEVRQCPWDRKSVVKR